MAYKVFNRVRMTVSGAPGTGDITIGSAMAGFQGLSAAGASDGDTFPYCVEDGLSWEYGVATYHASGSITRTTINQSSAGGATPLTLTSSATFFCALRAEDVSGGGSSATYEMGPFQPPLAAWFTTAHGASEPTPVLADVANRGLSFYASGFTASNQLAYAARGCSGWTGNWAMTVRMLPSLPMNNSYPQYGLALLDTSGRVQELAITGINGAPYIACANINTVDNNYNGGLPGGGETAVVPTWFRIRTDGANYIYGFSGDGLLWQEFTINKSNFLGTLAFAGIFVAGQNQATGSGSLNALGVLVTYYSDPDHP